MKYFSRALVAALAIGVLKPQDSSAAQFHAAPDGIPCASSACRCPLSEPCALNTSLYRMLRPGDTLQLHPGVYAPQTLRDIHGTAPFPIVISGTREGKNYLSSINALNGPSRDALELAQSSNLIIRDLAISGAARAGIRINNSHHIEIANNRISNNGVWGVFTNHANETIVRANKIIGPAEQHGIYFSNSGDGGLVTENYIVGFDACGVQLNGDLSMGGNEDVIGDGVIENVVIEGNFIANNGLVGGSAINLDGALNTLVRGNLMLGNQSAAVASFQIDGGAPTSATRIVDNVIIGARESRSQLIFANGSNQHLVMGNTVVTRNPYAAMISIEGTTEPSLLDRLRKRYPIPAEFLGNRYAHWGPMASFGESTVWESFEEWASVASDETSSLIPLDQKFLSAQNPSTLYREIYRQLNTTDALQGNRYREQLNQPQTNP